LRVLFDTTALYVAAGVSDLAFTPKIQRLLERSETVRLVSPISFNEIAIKANKGLTPLTRAHIEKLIFDLDLTVLPLIAEHSFRLFELPAHHNDPFDRMLIATALAEDLSIVASDREFKKYKGLRVIW
jgi:PIN domain nuclease of toxin-antitoxin system